MANTTKQERHEILLIVNNNLRLYDKNSPEYLAIEKIYAAINSRYKSGKIPERICARDGCDTPLTREQLGRNPRQKYCSKRCSSLVREEGRKLMGVHFNQFNTRNKKYKRRYKISSGGIR